MNRPLCTLVGLYLGFHSNRVLGPFVLGRLQHLNTSEVTHGHLLTPLRLRMLDVYGISQKNLPYPHHIHQ